MDIIKSLALALLLLATPACAAELSVHLIQDADDMRETAQQAIGLGMIEAPEQEWIDRVTAYYFALNVAWAQGDEAQYEAFHAKIEALYTDLVEDYVEPQEQEVPKTEL